MFSPVHTSISHLGAPVFTGDERRRFDVLWNRPVFRAPPLAVTPPARLPVTLPDSSVMRFGRDEK